MNFPELLVDASDLLWCETLNLVAVGCILTRVGSDSLPAVNYFEGLCVAHSEHSSLPLCQSSHPRQNGIPSWSHSLAMSRTCCSVYWGRRAMNARMLSSSIVCYLSIGLNFQSRSPFNWSGLRTLTVQFTCCSGERSCTFRGLRTTFRGGASILFRSLCSFLWLHFHSNCHTSNCQTNCCDAQ
jgi:hypothetical protein